MQISDAPSLLPHHRRDALFIVPPHVDILDVAQAIVGDDSEQTAMYIEERKIYKPSLAEMSDWCVDLELRLQFIILQPFVLAQPILKNQAESQADVQN